MLLTKTVKVNWNARNKEKYISLGYTFTKMKDAFDVNVNDLAPYSQARIKVVCDYCGKQYETSWRSYRKGKNNCKKDCCSDANCTTKKAKESLLNAYGVDNARSIVGVNEKIAKTNLKKYGCENPFGNKEIQEKIKKTNIRKYGFERPSCNDEIKNKIIKSEQEFHKKHPAPIGENSPRWKGGVEYSRVERATHEYLVWRRNVFSRDVYTCQRCGDRNGNGHHVKLCAHHIKNWKDNEDCRYDENNGITLCEKCHNNFHSIYGKRHNTLQQLNEFLGYIFMD